MRSRWLRGFLLGSVVGLLAACQPAAVPQGMDLQEALGGMADTGFARAIGQRQFEFPRDHGAHPDYRNEWWYITGNLDGAQGQRFGFQVTFFRIALAAREPEPVSVWSGRQLWMAHVALTDVAGRRHYHEQRFARAATGLAGQSDAPFRVWLEDWQLTATAQAEFPWQLQIASDDFSLQLELQALKPVVLQGDAGLSQKGREVGNASWYYSMPRLQVSGQVQIGETAVDVNGLGWLDREWSTSALDPEQAGWDWFSLQLHDGHDLMYYQLRRKDGSADPNSAGKWIDPQGQATRLSADAVQLTPQRYWRSPAGREYPVQWRLRLPQQQREWIVNAVLDAQEMQTAVIYWEGAVDVSDARSGEQLGRGYLEMAGYPVK